MRILIETIPHELQRYPTAGDWYYETDGDGVEVLRIRVSALSDWKREALVQVHELYEALLCRAAGVTQKMVDDFDLDFVRKQKEGLIPKDLEPGDSETAPYKTQHDYSCIVEQLMAVAMVVNWKSYADEVQALP
jgi:hypothetical protein